MQVAVVHDGTINPGGAVRVVIEACNALDADLYVGFSGKEKDWWQDRAPNDVTLLRRVSSGGTLNDVLTTKKILGLELEKYDIVLSSGPAAKFFQPYDDQLHIHYVHHPPLASLWFSGGLFAYLVKAIDRVETLSIPHLLANSELTRTRVRRHYNREIDRVIPPPVDIEAFTPREERVENQLIMVGRLEERKRPEVAIRAMEDLNDYTLKIVGNGPLREELEKDAPSNVTFLGYVDDSNLRRCIEESVAGIFLAKREDFGITPIEYMAAGTPVIGVDEPNTNNQVNTDTGVLVNPIPGAVADGARTSSSMNWDREKIRNQAERYNTDRFKNSFEEFINDVYR